MRTEISETESSIGKRTLRAATESMTTIALGKGEFKVYSGTRKSYVVNLVKETCECRDAEFNRPAEGCKHRQRVEMEIGERPIPDLGRRTDVEIMTGARVDDEPVAIADGGMVAPEPQEESEEITHAPGCENAECEGIDGDAERPLLSFECWDVWAAYDEQQRIEEVGE